jgi:hypothetical protein
LQTGAGGAQVLSLDGVSDETDTDDDEFATALTNFNGKTCVLVFNLF